MGIEHTPSQGGRSICRAASLLYLILIVLAQGLAAQPPGLTVAGAGFQREGRFVRCIGVNYFDAFARVLEDKDKAEEYRAGFRKLAEHDVPFIRFNCGGFYPVNWDLYRTAPEEYFRRLDRFVADAEESGIGLIPSFFWAYFTLPGLAGEPLEAWGDRKSETHRLMRKYVAEVVGRYHRSPAIWAWEFGNEYNLAVDLPGGAANHAKWFHASRGMPEKTRPGDALTSAQLRTALVSFAEAVREIDPHRALISGHSIPRSAAVHLEKQGTWTADGRQEWLQALADNHPSPIDTLCIHYYPFHDEKGTGLSGASLKESLKLCQEAADKAGKPLFVGEFGPPEKTDAATRHRHTKEMIQEMVDLRVPLSAVWVFDFSHQDVSIPANAEGDEMLSLIRTANNELTKE